MSVFSERRRVQTAIPLQPCLPRRADTPPTGSGWIVEIKHDGFRILARRDGDRVRLFTRNGYDFTNRFPKIAAALAALPVQSCVIDGEAIVVDRQGLSVFELLRYRHHDHIAVLCAFDLIELDGFDLRHSSRLSNARTHSPISSATLETASPSTSTSRAMAWPFSSMPVLSAARASCRSGWDRIIALAASITGSRSRTRRRQQ
jgi:hypothetical protein